MKEDTPSQHISNERYESILQAAESLFAEKGYDNVSTEEIARTAGVSKGLVYHYFKIKEDLLVEIMERGIDSISSLLASIKDSQSFCHRPEFSKRLKSTALRMNPAPTHSH